MLTEYYIDDVNASFETLFNAIEDYLFIIDENGRVVHTKRLPKN